MSGGVFLVRKNVRWDVGCIHSWIQALDPSELNQGHPGILVLEVNPTNPTCYQETLPDADMSKNCRHGRMQETTSIGREMASNQLDTLSIVALFGPLGALERRLCSNDFDLGRIEVSMTSAPIRLGIR